MEVARVLVQLVSGSVLMDLAHGCQTYQMQQQLQVGEQDQQRGGLRWEWVIFDSWVYYNIRLLVLYLLIGLMESKSFSEKYVILEKAEEGSYGAVYKARNKQTKEIVAVKKFKTQGKVGLPISFIRESYIFQILSGAHLVKVIETFLGEDEPIMVMEWLTTNLDRVVGSKKKFAIKEIFEQILRGVQEFHSCEVIHRDLKPSNIMLSSKKTHLLSQPDPTDIDTLNYHVRIIDCGMAKELDASKSMTNMVGSLFYRAPELLLGCNSYAKPVDVWALGCIFHFMVTGHTLFKADNQLQQFKQIISITGIQKSHIQNKHLFNAVGKMKLEDCTANWSETLKAMNQIEFDFLRKMVVIDPECRYTCRQLLNHPYFT